MPRTPRQSAQGAVGLMTAWLAAPAGPPDLFVDCLRLSLEEHPDDDKLAAAVELIMGMTQLSGGLLLMLEEATGTSAQETLQELGRFYAEI
jgi:hypothetical protein